MAPMGTDIAVCHVCVEPGTDRVHVLPLRNLTHHELSEGCWCEPKLVTYVPGHRDKSNPHEAYLAWAHAVEGE